MQLWPIPVVFFQTHTLSAVAILLPFLLLPGMVFQRPVEHQYLWPQSWQAASEEAFTKKALPKEIKWNKAWNKYWKDFAGQRGVGWWSVLWRVGFGGRLEFFLFAWGVFLDKKSVRVSLEQMDLECFVVSCLLIPAVVYKVSNVHLKPYNLILLWRKQFHGDKSWFS